MKIFLTGASGFVGKFFCKLAIRNGHFIFAPSKKKKINKNKNIKWLYGGFNKDWEKELSLSDILVHLAAAGVNNSNLDEIFDTNIFKSSELLRQAIKNNCKKWLIISTSSEYGIREKKKYFNFTNNTNRLPETEYGLSKAIFTDVSLNLAKKYKCQARVMRLFSIYGKGENKKRLYPSLLAAINKNKSFMINNPFETRDFTNIEYASKVLLDAINFSEKKFKIFQVWHVSENKPLKIVNFVKKIWEDKKGKNKLFLNRKNKVKFNHISDKNSVWKITNHFY